MASFKSRNTPALYKPAVKAEDSLLRDKAVPSDATDTITAVRWSPVANHLAAASWDGKVRIYDVANDLTASSVGVIDTTSHAFTCDWSQVSPN